MDKILTPCITCKIMLTCYLDKDYANNEPSPGDLEEMWLSENPETLMDDYDTVTEYGDVKYCDHEASYTNEEYGNFKTTLYRVAEESFEYYY